MKPNPVSPSSLNAELINLPAFSGRKWWVKFDEPEFSCEAGLTAIAASKIGDQLLRFLASAIDDSRCAADHKIEELDSQRGFLILGGNCDVTDCDHLSKDIVLRSARRTPLILKRTQGKPGLWSVNHRVWPPRQKWRHLAEQET